MRASQDPFVHSVRPACYRYEKFATSNVSCSAAVLFQYFDLAVAYAYSHTLFNGIWTRYVSARQDHTCHRYLVWKNVSFKTTAHWRWTSLYIAFETLLQHPQPYPTRYLSPWKPSLKLGSFSAPYVIRSDDFGPSLLLGSTTGWFMLSSCVFNMTTPIY